jgi:hypothetical protein
MTQRFARLARLLLLSTRAQATVEYALVISVTVALLLTVSVVVLNGLSAYYNEVTSVVCLPIP